MKVAEKFAARRHDQWVERAALGRVDEVWAHTQSPEVHQRGDIRFTKSTDSRSCDTSPTKERE